MLLDTSKSLSKFLPVSMSEQRPLWSVMIPVYNNTSFLNKIIEKVLSQYTGSGQMEIYVIDDCSESGDAEGIVNKHGNGIVNYFRQPVNVGHSKNYDTCIRKSKGKLIHILHQDDMVRDGFYERMGKTFTDYPDIGAAFCRHLFIDEKGNWLWISELEREEDGILDDWLMKIAEKQRIQYASMVVKREVYENLGGFVNKDMTGDGWQMAGEDWEMWVRIAANYKVGYVTEPLAEYRIHRASMTSGLAKSGQNVKDIHRIIERFSQYVPEDKREQVIKSASKHFANYSFENSKKILADTDDPAAAEAQLNEAIKLDPEIYSKDILLYSRLNEMIRLDGLSIVMCMQNDPEGIIDSLKEINSQNLDDVTEAEIIFADNGSEDNTYSEAEKILSDKEHNKLPYKIIRQEYSDFNSALKSAFDKAKFEYILVCDGRFSLSENFLKTVTDNIKANKETGLVISPKEIFTDSMLPAWLDEKLFNGRYIQGSNNSQEQNEIFNITGTVLRKSAWEKILDTGIIPDLSGETEYGKRIESQLPYILLKNNFTVSKEQFAVYRKFIPADSLEYEDFLTFWKSKGKESALLYRGKSGRYILRKTINSYSKFISSSQKESGKSDSENVSSIYAGYYYEKLMSQLNILTPNKSKQIKILKSISGNFYNKYFKKIYRQFQPKVKRSGITSIIDLSSEKKIPQLLLKSLAAQKVRSYADTETLIVLNKSDESFADSLRKIWSRYSQGERDLKFITAESEKTSAIKKAVGQAAYDYLVFFNYSDVPDENYLQNALSILRSNDNITSAAGKAEALFETEPPEWFEKFKEYFFENSASLPAGKDRLLINGLSFGGGAAVRKSTAEDILNMNTGTLFENIEKGENIFERDHNSTLSDSDIIIKTSPVLNISKLFSGDEVNWDKLRTIWRERGINDQNELYRNLKIKNKKIPFQLRVILNNLRKCGYENLLNYDSTNENNLKILNIEKNLGSLNSLLNQKTQNPKRQIRLIKKGARKKDSVYLRRLTNGYTNRIARKGVSVVICCYNSAKLLAVTLEHLSRQKTRKYVDWEVVIVNNASTDNTSEVAATEWKKYPDCKGSLRIAYQPIPGLAAAREKGIEESKYEYIVFCDDDNWLDENFVQNVVRLMRSNPEVAIAGAETQEVCEVEPPEWFHKWKNWSYAVGEQFDRPGDITWSRGFVWGAGMVLRRKALDKLYGDGFKSLLTDRKGKELASGGDTEICYAMRLAGWRIWYDPELKLKHYMTAPRLKWEYFLKLWKGFGVSTAGLDTYLNIIPSDMIEGNYVQIKKTWEENYSDTKQKLKEFGSEKVKNYESLPEGDPDAPLIVFNLARLEELKQIKNLYKTRSENAEKAQWKKEFFHLRLLNKKYKPAVIEDKTVWPWTDEPADIDKEKITEDIKISILTPSYLSEDKIEKAIQSVIRQGYKNYEHIVVDGGSKDNTVNILKKYPHINWVSEKDNGQSDAMNKAFDMSTGDIICYLNSDDFFAPGAFKNIVKEFHSNPNADMVVGNLILDMKSGPMIIYPEKDYKKIMLSFYYSFPINPVCYFYKRNVQEKIGKFPSDNHYTMDYWFLLKAYKDFKIHKKEVILGTFVLHEVNKTSSADNLKNTHQTMISHLKNNDMQSAPYYFYNYYKFRIFNKRSYRDPKSVTRYLKPKYIKSFQFGKDYSDRIFKKAYDKCYQYSYLKGLILLMLSGIVYPPNIFKTSRRSLFYRSVFGHTLVEKMRNYYYKSIIKKYELKESLKSNLKLRGNVPVILKTEAVNKNIFTLLSSGRTKEYSDVIFQNARENCYNYSYFKSHYLFFKSVIIRPGTIFKESRRSLLIRLFLGHKLTEIFRTKYYSSVLKSYEVKSGIKNKINSRYKYTQRLKFFPRDFYFYFRYRKFKARSKELYDEARITFQNNERSKTIKLLIPSFVLYPPSIFKRNKVSLFVNSFRNGTTVKKTKGMKK